MLNTDRLCLGCMTDNDGETVCKFCGWNNNTPNPDSCLPTKFRLNDRYLVGRVLSRSSDAVVYIGWDFMHDSVIHLREYFPKGLCNRCPDGTVAALTECKFDYNDGLLQFLNLNRSLEKAALPAVLPIAECFEENGTAYAVISVVQSISLEQFLDRNGGCLKWEQVRSLMLPLLDSLERLHENGFIHGGISPESIVIGRDGKLRMTDFGISATRTAGGAFGTDLAAGFAAAEQSGNDSILTPAADVYAVCAVLFRMLIGTTPPEAVSRKEKDSLSIPAHFAEELPRPVLVALANGLQVAVTKRTPDIETLRNEMVYGETAEQKQVQSAKAANQQRKNTPAPAAKKKSGAKYALISALITAAVFLAIGGAVLLLFRDQIFGSEEIAMNTDSDYTVEGPSENLGDFDSAVVNAAKQYSVPDFCGKYYAQLEDNEDYRFFKLTIAGKAYSDNYPCGEICAQSVAAGTGVERDTEIQLTISLGKQNFALENVCGLTEAEAKIALLKQGFLYANITVEEMYDKNGKPGAILDQFPAAGTTVNAEAEIKIYINTYEEDTAEEEAEINDE